MHWLKMSTEDIQLIDDTVVEVKSILPAQFIHLHKLRFPFSMHHSYYRDKLNPTNMKIQHNAVAKKLHAWAAEQSHPASAYIWQAIAGALLYSKFDVNSEYITNGILSVDNGTKFLSWNKN